MTPTDATTVYDQLIAFLNEHKTNTLASHLGMAVKRDAAQLAITQANANLASVEKEDAGYIAALAVIDKFLAEVETLRNPTPTP